VVLIRGGALKCFCADVLFFRKQLFLRIQGIIQTNKGRR